MLNPLTYSCPPFLLDAQVESVNIVGYQTLAASGQFFSSGATFIGVNDANSQWRLGDVLATGMDPDNDMIQFLNAGTAFTEISATYIDATLAEALGDSSLVGWWDLALENSLDDMVFPAGTGFLCNFTTPGITLTYAGEVLQGTIELDLSGQQFPMVSNFTPVDLTLGDLVVSGMDPDNDMIQFLNTGTAFTETSATYIDADLAVALGDPGLEGWWDLALENSLNAYPFPAGTAFLGNFTSPSVKITFPSPIAP